MVMLSRGRILATGLVIMMLGWVLTNSTFIDEAFYSNIQSEDIPAETELVGLSPNEHWLVVLVAFPDAPIAPGTTMGDMEHLFDHALGIEAYMETIQPENGSFTYDLRGPVIAGMSVEDYGRDRDGARDVGHRSDPVGLVEEVVAELDSDGISDADLDRDGTVDRFLILHTSPGQELDASRTGRIWSHFSELPDPIELDDEIRFEHYAMASLASPEPLGTTMHEMLHQMGAIDLYSVDELFEPDPWKGIGSWGIMATGNYNGDGAVPALPTGPTMELIGAGSFVDLALDWADDASVCMGPDVPLDPRIDGGGGIRIPISDSETVFIEHRRLNGFDARLPGEGVLVMVQDRSVRNGDQNDVNGDSTRPWLYVLEADQGGELRSGADDGGQSDLFTNGSMFGASGAVIRDHDGVRVPWTVTVLGEGSNMSIRVQADPCPPSLELDLEDHGSRFVASDGVGVIRIAYSAPDDCDLIHDLRSDFGNLTVRTTDESGDGNLRIDFAGIQSGLDGRLIGTIGCAGDSSLDIEHPWFARWNEPVPDVIDLVLPWDRASEVNIPLVFQGNDTMRYDVALDGPISRVATMDPNLLLGDGSVVLMDVDPNGLLTPRMYVNGELVIRDDTGETWSIPIAATTESTEQRPLDAWRTPSRILALCTGLIAIGILSGGTTSATNGGSIHAQESPSADSERRDPGLVDTGSQPGSEADPLPNDR